MLTNAFHSPAALVTATLAVGKVFSSHAISVVGTVIGAVLVPLWFFVGWMMIRAVINKQLLWPDKGEDRVEGGWVRRETRMQNLSKGAGKSRTWR